MQKHAECLLDTNSVLHYFLQEDMELAAKIKPVFDALRFGTKAALLLDCVLAECVYIFEKHYHVPRNEIAEKLDILLRYPGIVNQDKADLRQALELFSKNKHDIVDCILAARSRIGNP